MILLIDVPAQYGGAMTILNHYYEIAKKSNQKWVFVVSTPVFEKHDNIEVLNYPWIKNSWFHRLYFDFVKAPKLIKKIKPDEIISLQNVLVPRIKIKQTLYLHQPLPFSDIRFSFLKFPRLWIYQNVISSLILKSIKRADKVIVQTSWMKDSVIAKTKQDYKDKIIIRQPHISHQFKEISKHKKKFTNRFFYPASSETYKNHKTIIRSLEILKMSQDIEKIKVVFTLVGNENYEIKKLYKKVQNQDLPVDFIGSIPLNEVYEYYQTSVLLFPSYIETFGLPLLEAKLHQAPIIASNTPFSREILKDYTNVRYFEPFDAQTLAHLMSVQVESS